jgi:hypothetical protein
MFDVPTPEELIQNIFSHSVGGLFSLETTHEEDQEPV